MDIKFSFVQVVLFFSILILVVSTTSAGYRGRGTGRITSRRHSRREVSNHLTPPSQDASYTSYGPPSIQQHQPQLYRPGPVRIPPPSTEAPGSFSKFFSWLNPYSESPTQPRPDTQVPRYGPPNASPSSYQRPPSSPPHSYGLPQLPPAGRHGYLPPADRGKNCHPCDGIPWVPMADGVQKDTGTSGATNFEIQPSINDGAKSPNFGFSSGYIPDFTYRPLNHFASNENPYSAPIPYAHLYPGPMPPLFKSRPFTPSPDFHPTPSIQLESGSLGHTSDSIGTDGGHVEVLPPGAEVHLSGDVGEIRDSPPPGYEDDHHGGGYRSVSLNVEPSTIIHDDHLSTELTAGYKVQTPSAASVEVVQSISSAGISTSVDHPIHYEESPIIDLSNQNQNGPGGGDKDYTAGLNPPPNESLRSYGSQENKGSVTSKEAANEGLKNSYGISVNREQTRDSFVASTVTNRTFSYPTPSYGIPDVGGLPISHEATKPTIYESYPPMDSSKNGGAQHHNGSSHEQGINADQQDHGRIVDSYRQHIDQSSNNPNQQNGQLGFLDTPKPLVPYRPSSLYVPYPPYIGINLNQNRSPSSESSGPTTEESFLDAVVNSYANFKQEMDAKDNPTRPGVAYVPYPPYYGLNFNQNSLSPSEPTRPTTEQSFLDTVANSYANFKHEMDAKDNSNGADIVYVPYPPYSGPNFNHNNSSPSEPSIPTTEASFLDDIANSYANFKHEMDSKHQSVRDQQDGLRNANQNDQPPISSGSSSGTTWVSQPQPSFSNSEQINPTVYVNGKILPPSSSSFETKQRQSGVKKNKQVQIIIPYTSQHTPSPFQPVTDDWSGRGPLEQIQGRKVPVLTANDQNYVGQESNKVEIISPLKPLENLLSKEISKKPSFKQANNSIDVSKLQKNIDNWTIQEYSRGITASTALPSFSHPYLLPAKKIPKEYLNKNQSSVSNNVTELNQPNLPGFNYNDLEHEGSASIRVDVPHVQVVTAMGVSKPVEYKTTQSSTTITSTEPTTSSSSVITSTSTTTTEASWAELPVSISSHNNERVYVVTPLPERSAKSWPGFSELEKSEKFEAIERVYQVLPQAVNNLATTSVSGPEHSPLWGIMEHDQYARSDNEISSTSIPILYSGHSKVSNAKSH